MQSHYFRHTPYKLRWNVVCTVVTCYELLLAYNITYLHAIFVTCYLASMHTHMYAYIKEGKSPLSNLPTSDF